jgi:23S rRNA (pseudouridine1915-N3)-methyltransferase
MRIAVISASNRQPDWVQAGFHNYARRLRGRCAVTLTEIPLARRAKTASSAQLRAREGERMLAAVPRDAHVVALDETGHAWNTGELKERLRRWIEAGRPVALLLGGPDGLAADCLDRAAERWSLSPLTLPHGLVRIVVAEALYRAFSLLENHPYHRD